MIRAAVAALALPVIVAITAITTTGARAGEADPFGSAAWPELRAAYLGDAPVVFDYTVGLVMPSTVDDAFSVPVVVKLSERLGPVSEIMVIAENNPIQAAAQIFPRRAFRTVGMNIRLEQSTPVRVAALDADGVWHVASARVAVNNPGGCSSPQAGAGAAGTQLGAIAIKRFNRPDRATRVKVGISHPMDTGLAPDPDGELVPAYYVDRVTVADAGGPIADLVTWAALSSDPSFFFDLTDAQQSVRVTASDTRGLAFEALEGALASTDDPS